MFADKEKADPLIIVEWVFDNVDIADVRPIDAPSAGAWSLLVRVRLSSHLLLEFYRMWAKLLPRPTDIENQSRLRDDESEYLPDITAVERAAADAILQSGAERPVAEFVIPA